MNEEKNEVPAKPHIVKSSRWDEGRAIDAEIFRRELEMKRAKRSKDYNTWAATGNEGR